MKTCSVKNCYEDRASGDSLFCRTCRATWRKYLHYKNLDFPELSEEMVNKHLEFFQTLQPR